MKPKLLFIAVILIFSLFGCDDEETYVDPIVDISSLSFSGCNEMTKSTDTENPSIQLVAQPDGRLLIKLTNTEFCCGTDSLSLSEQYSRNEINLEIIDHGPFTRCYCPHNVDFTLEDFSETAYDLTMIESESAYVRDTFLVHFEYSQQLDTTITKIY